MEVRLALAAVLVAIAVVVARIVERRRPRPDAPAQGTYPVPRQLDRDDFTRPDAPWLVVLFSAATCESCGPMADKVAALESDDVATADIEVGARPDLHQRYGIEGVPVVVVAGADGAVRAAFVGPTSAAHLWAAVAECRVPGSSPEPGLGVLD